MDEFDKWNSLKKQIENNKFIYTKVGEIYNCMLGKNIGYEQSGKGDKFLRPILVYKKFSRFTILAIPLSTTQKRGKYYFEFSFLENKTSVALLSQIRLIDTRRLYKKLGRISKKDFENLEDEINKI